MSEEGSGVPQAEREGLNGNKSSCTGSLLPGPEFSCPLCTIFPMSTFKPKIAPQSGAISLIVCMSSLNLSLPSANNIVLLGTPLSPSS